MEIKGKVIVVTGASEGIGLAVAHCLAEQGAKLVLAARSAQRLQELAKKLPDAIAVPTDMRKPEDIKNMIARCVEKYGRVDILINNAGQAVYGPMEGVDLEQYKQIMELNVYGVLRAMQEVIPLMRRTGGGMILNISSRVSKNYYPNLGAYASTKYALNAISLTARAELAKDGIIVSVFHPKMTATDFGKHAMGTGSLWTHRPSSIPMPEVDQPEPVARKIAEQIRSEEPELGM